MGTHFHKEGEVCTERCPENEIKVTQLAEVFDADFEELLRTQTCPDHPVPAPKDHCANCDFLNETSVV